MVAIRRELNDVFRRLPFEDVGDVRGFGDEYGLRKACTQVSVVHDPLRL